MAIKIDQLRKMGLEELVELQTDIGIVLQEKREEATNDFRMQIEEKAKELGIDIYSLYGMRRRGPKSGGTVPPKYRNPKDHSQTWSGRGREPAWIKGKDRKAFLI
jgi:DNA-binding protein H-NS